MIELTDLRREFGATVALAGVDVSFPRQRIVTLLGENGSGKSTMIKTIAGVVEPTSGSVTIDGQSVRRFTPHALRQLGVAVCHQELLASPNRSIDENVHLGRHRPCRRAFSRAEQREQTEAVFAELGVDNVDINAEVGTLPIVLQQLTVIARALVLQSPIIVLDEPTAALGRVERDRLFKVLTKRRDTGTTVVLVSHRMDEILEHSDQIVVLANGHVVGSVERADFDERVLLEMMVP